MDKEIMDKDLILQGIKKELESLEKLGSTVNQIGFLMRQTNNLCQKSTGELLQSMSFSEHILQLNTLIKQLQTIHKKEKDNAYYRCGFDPHDWEELNGDWLDAAMAAKPKKN